MNSIQLLNKIKIQISEVSNITEQLLSENRSANGIEIDLLKKQCVEIYESILKLKTYSKNENGETKETILEVKEEIPEENVEEIKAIIKDVEINKTDIVSELEEEIPVQPVNEIIKEVLEEVTIVIEEKKEQTFFTETIYEKKSNLINIPHNEPSLHQKISEHKQADINERINDSKVESLKSAIGLNKKIAFVNELFKENTVEYAKAIDKLNLSTDLNEAMRYFNELKHQFSWNNESDHVVELEQLIQKRFR